MTELVVVVVILSSIAVVVQRSDSDAADGIDRGSLIALGGHFHRVIVDLLDAGDVRHAFAAHGLVLRSELSHEGFLGVRNDVRLDSGFARRDISSGVAFVLGLDFRQELFRGGSGAARDVPGLAGRSTGQGAVLVGTEAPQRHGQRVLQAGVGGNFVSGLADGGFRLVARVVGGDVIHDALRIRSPVLVKGLEDPSGLVRILAGLLAVLQDRVEDLFILGVDFAGGLGQVILQTNDLIGGQSGGADISRIAVDIIGEDDVIRGQGLAVGELQVLAQLHGVGGGAVVVLDNGNIRRTIVEIIRAVIAAGLTLDRVVHDRALTVGGQGADGRHGNDVLIIGGIRIEGAELLGEGAVTHNQRSVAAFLSRRFGRFRRLGRSLGGRGDLFHRRLLAGGQHHHAHAQNQHQRKHTRQITVFHGDSSLSESVLL